MSEKKRFLNIDFLKGICIIFVIITHYDWIRAERRGLLFPFSINMAVPIFMIISGYLFSKSFENHKIDTFKRAYGLNHILTKIIRFTVPFAIIYIIEEIVLTVITPSRMSLFRFADDFVKGGIGKGSYYYPFMIQFIFVFPLIYFTVKKFQKKGFLFCIIANLAYEIIQRLCLMPEKLYEYLIFRYIVAIAFGCLLSSKKAKLSKIEYLLFFVGGVSYIVTFNYLGFTPIITRYWTRTSFIACFYIMPIAAYLITKSKFHFAPIDLFGKASFNIFLVQMFYFVFADKIYGYVGNVFLRVLINLIICLTLGVLFYYIENPISKALITWVNKLTNGKKANHN